MDVSKLSTKRKRASAKADIAHTMVLEAASSGEWLPAEELQGAVLAAAQADGDVCLNVSGLDYLDAASLQLLLALALEKKARGRQLRLLHASAGLSQWFAYAGATSHFA